MFNVTIEDIDDDGSVGNNNIEERLVTVIILDENDNTPVFQNVSITLGYECKIWLE